jgi:FAD:protein FMN transferase
LLAGLLAAGCAAAPPAAPPTEPRPAPHLVADGQYRMGTLLEVTVVSVDDASAQAAIDAAFAEAEALDALLSRYREQSDVSRLNRAAGGPPVRVDPRTREVLSRAIDCARLTHGAFDVTVGPLVELWTRAAQRGRAPSPRELAAARARVGAERIALGADGGASLPAAGMALDLGGIGKGYALDAVLPVLRERGVTNALLNFGESSVWALGAAPDADGWRLLMRDPRGGYLGVVTLRDVALSISSSLGQSSEIGGVRYGHVVDPRSGMALTRTAQAAVVAPDATLAEALSTALLVLAPAEGLALVESLAGAEAQLVDGSGRATATAGWSSVTRFEPLPPGR